MKEYIDQILSQLPDGEHKKYLETHKEDFAKWEWDHEEYPLYAYFRLRGLKDPEDAATCKVLDLNQ